MEKISTLLIALFCTCFSFAQTVPNGDFESWTDEHTATGWNSSFYTSFPFTYNGFSLDIVIDYNAATRNATAHTGTYCAQLSTQTANAQLYGSNLYSIPLPGMIQLGQFNTEGLANIDFENADMDNLNLTDYVYGGVPFTEVPAKITAWVSYFSTADTMRAGVILTRWNNGEREIVAQGDLIYGENSDDFVQVEIPVTVKEGMEGVAPDTMNIIFSSASGTADGNTLLAIDDIEIVMTAEDSSDVRIFDVTSLPIFSICPNPTSDVVKLTPATHETYAARMFDINGKMVWNAENLQGETQVNVTSFSKGTYFMQVKQGNNVKSEKVIVQ